ncbi:MAG: hypothetical protein AB7S44_01980 [Spirochaetales bacterium]
MNNFKILMKNNFNILIGSLQGKKERKKMTVMIGLVVLMGLGFFVLSLFQAYSQYVGLSPLGLSKIALFNGVLISLVTLTLISVMKTTSARTATDADLLLSLPIKKSTIAISKVVSTYLFDAFFMILLFLPYVIWYLIYDGFSVPILLFGLASALLVPLFAMGLEHILTFVVTRIFNRSKYAALLKSLIAIFAFFCTLALFAVSMPNYGTLNPADIDAFINQFPPVNWFINFVLAGNIIDFIKILIITILPAALGVKLYSENFGKTFVGYTNTNTELIYKNKTSALSSLIKKELKRYVLTPIYILNTIIGPIFIVILTVFVLIKGSAGLSALIGITIPTEIIFGVLTLMYTSFVFLTMISPSTISLEGKNLWVLKSIPVAEKDIFLSKAAPNLLATAPFVAVGSIVLSIALQFTILQAVLFALIPLLASAIISFGGVLINLMLPKLEWSDEVSVVKNGMSTVVTMLCGFALLILLGALYFIFPSLPIEVLAIIGATLFIVLLVVIIRLLFTKGKTLWQKL